MTNRCQAGGSFLGGNRIFGPAKYLYEHGLDRESNARQKDCAQQGQGNIKVCEGNVDGWKTMVEFQIETCHSWNGSAFSLAHDE